MRKDNPPAVKPPVAPLLYLLVFTAGFTVMLVEITAPRILGPFFGTSVHVWTSVIGVVLAALSMGYYIGGRIADRWPSPILLALIVMGGCLITALTPVAAPWLGRSMLATPMDVAGAKNVMRFGTLLTSLAVFFLPALLLAVVGPFTIRCIAAGRPLGRTAGTVYAVGTVGSLLGTFLPTFVLIPWLGSRGAIFAATTVLFVVAILVLAVHRKATIGGTGGKEEKRG